MSEQDHIYVGLLRGINVGGHKKVPMADLKALFLRLGFKDVHTILNTGNIIFKADDALELTSATQKIAGELELNFGFQIPLILRGQDSMAELVEAAPFKDVDVTPDIRLYVSFLGSRSEDQLQLPFETSDGSFKILQKCGDEVCSVLDVSKVGTIDAMVVLEKHYGKHITTRNWNTVLKIASKMLG